MYIKNIADIQIEKIEAGTKTSRQVLITAEEGPNFAMRRFIIEPGGEMPKHTNTVEHEQFVLNGRAEVGIGDRIYEVKKNDVVFIPADVPHYYKVKGDESFEFLCMIPNKPDKIEIIE